VRAPAAGLEIGAVADSTGVARALAATRALAGTAARPVVTLVAGGPDEGSGESGGGAIPGARVNFGAPSPPTLARPTTVRVALSAAVLSGAPAPSESAWDVEVAPGVACVSVMN
jgi:hypothetical protein